MRIASIILTLVFFGYSFPGYAQDKEKEELIKELLIATNAMDQLIAMRDILPQQIEQQMAIQGVSFSEDQIEILKEVTLEAFIKAEDDFLIAIILLYEENFTEDELRQQLAFYQTDAGKSIVAKMPQLMAQILEKTNLIIQKILPELQVNLAKRFQELEERENEESSQIKFPWPSVGISSTREGSSLETLLTRLETG